VTYEAALQFDEPIELPCAATARDGYVIHTDVVTNRVDSGSVLPATSAASRQTEGDVAK
jgi:hypothetical protein